MDLSSVKKNFAVITNIVKDSYISRKESQVARWLKGDLLIQIKLYRHFSLYLKSLYVSYFRQDRCLYG